MARFASAAELEAFLCKLEPDYGQYASALWQHQVRTAQQLANARKLLLLSWGLIELHVDDIKVRANNAGERLAYNAHISDKVRKMSVMLPHNMSLRMKIL